MLAKVARWLRILGVGVETPELKSDNEFIKYAREKNLILLTMDVELSKRGEKQKVRILLVPKKTLEEQLAFILKEFSIELSSLPSKTICPKCNGNLRTVEKNKIENAIYKRTLENNRLFWECEKCKNVFWEGSHWNRINEVKERIGKLLE